MIVLDRLLVGSLKFVLGKLSAAVEAELDNEQGLREELLAAQMRLELGELDEAEFAELESRVLARLREIQERKRAKAGASSVGQALASGDFKVSGVEIEAGGDGD